MNRSLLELLRDGMLFWVYTLLSAPYIFLRKLAFKGLTCAVEQLDRDDWNRGIRLLTLPLEREFWPR